MRDTSPARQNASLMASFEGAEAVLAGLRDLAPGPLSVGASLITDRPLFDVEQEYVKAATTARRREFASGRGLLRELIGAEIAIPAGQNRAPILPAGFCGSLAHDDRFVVAAVGRQQDYRSVGVDIEPVRPLDREIARLILRPEELGLDAHLAFTLKEAAYKAWSGLGGRILEHHEVRVSISGSRFQAEVLTTGTVLGGAFTMAAERWLALVVLGR